MKTFECLVLSLLKSITDPHLDPLQFAYRANRSVDDVVNIALHFLLQHLDSPGTYARILALDFSSAFNTIIPILLSPEAVFSLYTNSCTFSHHSVKLLQFADDTTLIGLICARHKSAYSWEIDHLTTGNGYGLQEGPGLTL
ncbi:hypothetical protein F2P81_001079 [Scophthalmus maximus]|uniref:Reverse transcriptase domain-containing protein n=1 Tax=Scophthalmus maximus TaxID=52904 RepID=A0A6A4TIU6_SCOMX|nr:hypothetical protein F2P81_001079 [Scophthalmus maximus]